MKKQFLFPLCYSTILGSCFYLSTADNKTKANLPGIYGMQSESAFSFARNTLMIQQEGT